MTKANHDLPTELRHLVKQNQQAKVLTDEWNKETERRRILVCHKWTEIFNACTPIEFSEIVQLVRDKPTEPRVTGSHV
jgi:hypothetical protein